MKLILFFLCCTMIHHNYRKERLISSSSLWIVCYLMIFILYPLFSGETFKNAELIDVCALIGMVFYIMGASFGERLAINKNENKRILAPDFNSSYIGFWFVMLLFVASIITKIGTSGFRAVLLGSITANQLTWSDELSMGNLFIYLMNMLIPFVVAVWIQADKSRKSDKIKALICLVLFVGVSLAFSYTRLFIMCTLVIVFFHEMKDKTPRRQLMVGLIAVLILTLFMIFLNFYRNFGSSNAGNFWTYINIGYVFESTDFAGGYTWFNELLNFESPYIFPLTYLKPVFAFVPRSVWPTKPEPISLDILRMINPSLISMGYSTAGNSVLGEGYAVMGWIGIAIFPFIWGCVCVFLDRKYRYKISVGEECSLWIIGYYIFSSFIIISGQRGDWSQYGVIIVWLFFLPLVLASKIHTRRIRFTFGKSKC